MNGAAIFGEPIAADRGFVAMHNMMPPGLLDERKS
jgi:hypothetical protein